MKKRPVRHVSEDIKKARKALKRDRLMQHLRQNTWLVLFAVLVLIALILLLCVISGWKSEREERGQTVKEPGSQYDKGYLCSASPTISIYDRKLNETGTAVRGDEVTFSRDDTFTKAEKTYYLSYFNDLQYGYVAEDNLTDSLDKVVLEKTIYVRTPQNLRTSSEGLQLGNLAEQGTELQVLGYDFLQNGVVHLYEVSYGNEKGYISGEYTTDTLEKALEIYDRFGVYMIHSGREDRWGGGDAATLDYWPREKANFEDNVMPDKVYALYLTCDPLVLANIDKYIEYAKTTTINAFVVNIIDGTSVGYETDVYLEYSPTAYQYANNDAADYQEVIRKIKDAGFYAIGRLTVFNDSFFVTDHPEYAISDTKGDPLWVANSYWPSAFCRYVWEYKVALALDAVRTMGFDEIQFDYVRFPDGTWDYEKAGTIDYHNEYDETKAQAIQRFLMYATDKIHDVGAYVGADVFGETNGAYVAAYGQYWPAVSNIVDVISGMPYPDHFSQNGDYKPWLYPHDTVLGWSKKAATRQEETPSPAKVRTWVQAYDAIRPPYNTYGPVEVGGELEALQEGNIFDGFMAWQALCSLKKMDILKPCFDCLGVPSDEVIAENEKRVAALYPD